MLMARTRDRSPARACRRGRPSRSAATRLTLLAGCAVLLSSCADGSAPSPDADRSWSSVRSMAGDTVVMRSSGDLPAAGTHELTELWRIGDVDGVDSTVTFGRIAGVAVREDNLLAVFDEALTTLRLYDASGRFIRTVGRKGAGPGEYAQANGLAFLPNGQLALWDPGTARITLYDLDTATTASWAPPVTGMFMNNALAGSETHALTVGAPLRDTTELQGPRFRVTRTAYFLYDATGTITDTVIAPPPAVEPIFATAATESMVAVYGVPYTPISTSRLLSDGRLVVGTSNAYRFDVTGAGAPLRIEVGAARVPVERSEANEQRAQVEWQMQSVDSKWSWTMDDIPSEKPYFDNIFPTEDGRLWVAIATPSERIPERTHPRERAGRTECAVTRWPAATARAHMA